MKTAVLLAAALLMAPGGPQIAQTEPQSEIFVPPKKAPPPAQPQQRQQAAPPRRTAPQAISGCVRLDVQVAARDANNEAWDPFPGSTQPPDITVYDASRGTRLFGCDDSYTCTGTLDASGPALNLLINDDDYDAPDFIGQGACSLSRSTCTIGLARLRLSRC